MDAKNPIFNLQNTLFPLFQSENNLEQLLRETGLTEVIL